MGSAAGGEVRGRRRGAPRPPPRAQDPAPPAIHGRALPILQRSPVPSHGRTPPHPSSSLKPLLPSTTAPTTTPPHQPPHPKPPPPPPPPHLEQVFHDGLGVGVVGAGEVGGVALLEAHAVALHKLAVVVVEDAACGGGRAGGWVGRGTRGSTIGTWGHGGMWEGVCVCGGGVRQQLRGPGPQRSTRGMQGAGCGAGVGWRGTQARRVRRVTGMQERAAWAASRCARFGWR